MKQTNKLKMIAAMALSVLSFTITSCSSDDNYEFDYYLQETSNNNSDSNNDLLGLRRYYNYINVNINQSELTDVDIKNVEIVENRILDNLMITDDGSITFKGLTPRDLNINEDIFYLYTKLLEGEQASIIQDSKSKQIKRIKNRSPETGGGNQGSFWYNIIINRLDSQIEKDHFAHWWAGTGSTLNLSDTNWSGIKTAAEDLRNTNTYKGDTIINNTTYQIHQINFYNNETYGFALGVSTMYFIGSTAHGLYDYYDFDSKPWGVREILTEAEIRFVAQLGKKQGAKDYIIYYGVH